MKHCVALSSRSIILERKINLLKQAFVLSLGSYSAFVISLYILWYLLYSCNYFSEKHICGILWWRLFLAGCLLFVVSLHEALLLSVKYFPLRDVYCRICRKGGVQEHLWVTSSGMGHYLLLLKPCQTGTHFAMQRNQHTRLLWFQHSEFSVFWNFVAKKQHIIVNF